MVSTDLFRHCWCLFLQLLPASRGAVRGTPAASPCHGDRRKPCLTQTRSLLSSCLLLLSSAPAVCALSFPKVKAVLPDNPRLFQRSLCPSLSACWSAGELCVSTTFPLGWPASGSVIPVRSRCSSAAQTNYSSPERTSNKN